MSDPKDPIPRATLSDVVKQVKHALLSKEGGYYARGFDRGNYGNAYESNDWDTWYANNCGTYPKAYRDGMLLGFFSSYELDEIDDECVRETVEQLRAKYGDE